MRRGRIFIYLALIIIIALAGGYIYYTRFYKPASQANTPPTPSVRYVQVISAAQNIAPGVLITQEMLGSYEIPETNLQAGLFTNPADVVNMYATIAIPQGAPITASSISAIPGNVNLPGSSWSTYIPQGLTAISIPVTRLSSTAYGIRDGDYVNIIVSMLLVDIDPASQTLLPQKLAGTKLENGSIIVTPMDLNQGFFQVDEVANALQYLYPPESQRPRLVTQMIMQNIQVLHVGSFPLPGQADTLVGAQPSTAATTPTPNPNEAPAPVAVVNPDVITLMVTPQDSVTLTYMMYSGVQINLTLRNPNDVSSTAQPDAAMLEYLLTQYNIPVPAKLPYSLQPRTDILQQPVLQNDAAKP